MQLIFHRILENFLHPKPGAKPEGIPRHHRVKLDPKLAPNLQSMQLFIYKLTKLAHPNYQTFLKRKLYTC